MEYDPSEPHDNVPYSELAHLHDPNLHEPLTYTTDDDLAIDERLMVTSSRRQNKNSRETMATGVKQPIGSRDFTRKCDNVSARDRRAMVSRSVTVDHPGFTSQLSADGRLLEL